MAQKDYVGRGKSSGTRRKTPNRKKKRSSSGKSKTMIVLAAAVLITFIGGQDFIAHNELYEAMIVPNRGKNAGSGLPPKPEERWRYIKELENRQIGVHSPAERTAGGEVNSSAEAPIQPVQKSAELSAAKEPLKEKQQRWLVQCGSFKANDHAESVRAQLALAGIESCITAGGGWNRVLLGPYSSSAGVDKILQKVRAAGVSNCIPIAAGG